jgi:hypothetical protein
MHQYKTPIRQRALLTQILAITAPKLPTGS